MDIKEHEIAQVLKDFAQKEIQYLEISIQKPTLEDYFIQVIGRPLDTMEQIL